MMEDFHFGSIAIIGDVMLDRHVFGAVERISPEAPVPVLRRSGYQAVPGGAGNVAVNAAVLGCKVALVGLVGDDPAGEELLAQLGQYEGLDLSGMVRDAERCTTTKTRVVSGQYQIVRVDDEQCDPAGDAVARRLMAAAERVMAGADVVVCSDYAKGVLSDGVIAGVIAMAQARGVPVIVDPKRADFFAYRGAALVTPNRAELQRASGMPVKGDAQIAAAAAAVSEQFGGDVLVTRSEEGMSLWRRDAAMVHARGRAAEVFDVSGAGDTVVATLASVLSAGRDMETAMTIASHAAAIAVSKLGTASVSREELGRALHGDSQPEEGAVPMEKARQICDAWRRMGERIVFANGCFDLLHPGHVALLKGAAAQGDRLIVALNTDASVKRLKGASRPVQDQAARATVMGALRMVDMVVLFDEDTPIDAIKALCPDVIVKGADYRVEEVVGGQFVRERGGEVVLIDLVAGRSTTGIIKAMEQSEREA
jgi:D-beta-D-heptose 7-phosphate kinase/D-beta-D-heptose 1-phosphate adenosyltransferase